MRGCITARIIVSGVICLIVQTTFAVAAPVQWTTASGGNGRYYEFKEAYLISWADAKEAAQVPLEVEPGHLEIGYLVTITSAAENDFINTALNTGSADSYAWTGGHEPNDEGPWFWATGPEAGVLFSIGATPTPPFHFADWGPFEPNDSHATEDYCGINLGLQCSSNPPGYWADLQSPPLLPWSPVAGYVVEWTPEPTSLALIIAALARMTRQQR